MQKDGAQKGFTLIEMIVAIALFSVVTVVGLGVMADTYNTSRLEKQSSSRLFAIERSLDIMAREMQAGRNFVCGGVGDCDWGTSVVFDNKDGQSVRYYYDTSGADPVLKRVVGGVTSEMIVGGGPVEFTGFSFFVSGTGVDDNIQPRIRVVVQGDIKESSEVQPFGLDMFISQRDIDG